VGPTCQQGERGQGNDSGLSPGGPWAERVPGLKGSPWPFFLFFVPFLFSFFYFLYNFCKIDSNSLKPLLEIF
jgi:hypothetical protein